MRKHHWLTIFSFLAPFTIVFLLFIIAPLAWGFYISLTNFSLLETPTWIGLSNYAHALGDSIFLKALRNTFLYVLGNIPLFIIALAISLALKSAIRGKGLFKAIILLPYIIPIAVHGFVFHFIYEPRTGALANALMHAGLKEMSSIGWLTNARTAIFAVMAVWTYVYMGYMMNILHAGLQEIPSFLYDAAKIDGAGPWTRLWHIILPLLSNVLVYVFVTGTILSFQIFPLVWILTGEGFGLGSGGPAYSTISLDLYIYQSAFRDLSLGYASAMGFIMLILTFAISTIPFKFLPEVRYE